MLDPHPRGLRAAAAGQGDDPDQIAPRGIGLGRTQDRRDLRGRRGAVARGRARGRPAPGQRIDLQMAELYSAVAPVSLRVTGQPCAWWRRCWRERRVGGTDSRAQGLPAEAVLARAGLDTATLSRKGARIPFAAHVALLEHAAAATRDPCFGLHLGAALHPPDLGLVGYLGANAATLGDVLYVAGKYLPLLTEGTRVEIDTVGDHVRVAQHLLDPAGAGSRQLADLGASSLVRVTRLVTGTMLAPARVELPFDSCDDEAEHRRVLGAPTRPGQPRTAVVLEQRQLALRAAGADPDLFDLLEQVCRERVGALPDRRDLRARAENVIVELLPYSAPSLDRVGRRLGTSSRSLIRRLASP